MTDDYDAADNARKCYELAIKTMREKLESFHRVEQSKPEPPKQLDLMEAAE